MGQKRVKGIVKWFNDEAGYGFIISNENEYFVHWRSIIMPGHKKLETGDYVYFEPTTVDGKLVATNVTKVVEDDTVNG